MKRNSPDGFAPNLIYEYLQELTNAAGSSLVNKEAESEVKVHFLPDASVTPGKFKRKKLGINSYLAHPDTIRSLRPDIFVVGLDGLEDFSKEIVCDTCAFQFDLQFFFHCPVCLTQSAERTDGPRPRLKPTI